jgi:hypothetical protein
VNPEENVMPYYVMIKNGQGKSLLAGPLDTRELANQMVDPARAEAEKIDPMTRFMEFGTVRVGAAFGPNVPYGKLNAKLGLPIAPVGHAVIAYTQGGYEPAEQRVNVVGQQGNRHFLAERGVTFDVHNPTVAQVRAEIERLTTHGRHRGHKGCDEAAALLTSLIQPTPDASVLDAGLTR